VQAQYRAETSIDTLTGALAYINSALESYSEGKGPLVGTSLSTYQSGLDLMQSGLQKIKAAIVARPANVAARSSKVLSLLGQIDTFSSLRGKIGSTATPATSGR
jgi:hypothetical protein